MTENITTRRRLEDGTHFIGEDYLPGGAKLHRFDNAGGYPLSAVYFRGIEVCWAIREDEENMLKDWERDWRIIVSVLDKEKED